MAYKNRAPRQRVSLSVRYRGDGHWADAQIANVSATGVMALCQTPPPRGSYVEIRRGSYVIVGRVAWSATDRFGVRARERIEPAELVAAASGQTVPAAERRQKTRQSPAPVRHRELADRQAASARFARAFNFVAVAAFGILLAVVVAQIAKEALSDSLSVVNAALKQPR